jgi:crotonobetainyl-CoA:carnitine CoA-transferase CaiB-like acyl-CoA transferase
VRRLPPELGQHTREVLAEAGYSAEQIERLLADGAAVAARAQVSA